MFCWRGTYIITKDSDWEEIMHIYEAGALEDKAVTLQHHTQTLLYETNS